MQNVKRRYDRFFIMFKQELTGYSIDGREPNGYCKIEIRDGKGKVSTYIQGLKPLKDGSMYRIYLIAVQGDKSLGIPIGWLDIDNKGRGECKWEFNPDNLDGTGLAIEDFNVGAIILNGNNIKELVAPIVGYKDKEVLWKNGFKDFSVYNGKTESKNSKDSIQNISEPKNIVPSFPKQKIEQKNIIPDSPKKDVEQKNIIPDSPKKEVEQKNIIPDSSKKDVEQKNIMPDSSKKEVEQKNIIPDSPKKEVEQKKMVSELPKHEVPQIVKDSSKSEQKKVKLEESKIEAERTESAQEETNPHKIFNNMVNKFYAEMEELEKYKILNSDDMKTLELNLKEPEKEDLDDITYMFKNNEAILPFEHSNKAIKWIKVAPFELVTLSLPISYIKHQFINAGWKKYKYLILGRYSQNNIYKYILGVPDMYDDSYKTIATDLGFKKFTSYKGKSLQKGELGYWLMDL